MRRRTLACALLPLLITGCGGSSHHSSSSSSSSTDTIGPQIALAWPARARAFSAPVAATAAQITFPGAGANGTDLTQVVSRPSAAAAVTQTYQLGFAVHPGKHLVRVDFLANSASTGTPLATATLNVTVTDAGALKTLDGKDLGTVAYGSNVTGLTVSPDQTLEVGTDVDLFVVAATGNGIVALRPGSVTFTLTAGSGTVSLGANGSLTGLAAGIATLTATVDGVTSPAAPVAVLPAPVAARVVGVQAADLVADPNGARAWLALPAANNGSAAQSLNLATGTLGAPIALGGDPNVLAISDDGSTLYAGLKNVGSVRRVDLTAGTAGSQFSLPSTGYYGSGYAADIAVQPGNPSTIALCTQDFNDTGGTGPHVYDNGVARPNGLGTYDGDHLLWTAADRIVAYEDGTTDNRLLDVAVDANGAAPTGGSSSGLPEFSIQLTLAGGRLYDRSGIVFDAASLNRVGAFPLPPASGSNSTTFVGPAVNTAAGRAYFVESDGTTLKLLTYDAQNFNLMATRRISGPTNANLASGVHSPLVLIGTRLVLRLADQVAIVDLASL